MAEWLYEDGIGEERAILVEGGGVRAARIEWGEGLRSGLVAEARLVARTGRRGTVRFADGAEALVDAVPRDASDGALLIVRIVRSAIAERGRTKLAHARPAPGAALRPAPTLHEELAAGPVPLRRVRPDDGAFAAHEWDEVTEQAVSGSIAFTAGMLTISPTPAMTLIDIDGTLAPKALALAAVPPLAAALGRLDLGGSIGVDFPTLADRSDRQAVDAALGEALAGWRGERTAMNGFGFVQLVSRLERPSLVLLAQRHPVGWAARALLRQAECVPPGGALLLTTHPAVRAAMAPNWLSALAARTGRTITWHEDASLALAAGFAQAI